MLAAKLRSMTVVRFKAIFVKVDGLVENDVGSSYGLMAENKKDAEKEAMQAMRPHGSNFVKVLDEGRVVSRLGFELNA